MSNGDNGYNGDGEAFSGAGDWAYRGQPSAYGTYNPPTAQHQLQYASSSAQSRQAAAMHRTYTLAQASVAQAQQRRQQVPPASFSPSMQNSVPNYLAPSTLPNYDSSRNYADIHTDGQIPLNNRSDGQGFNGQLTAQEQQFMNTVVSPANAFQSHIQGQGSPRAQVIGSQLEQMFHPNLIYNGPAYPMLSNQHPPQQQHHLSTSQSRHTVQSFNGYLGQTSNLGSSPANDDAWQFDRSFDFTLFDLPMDRYLVQAEPYVAHETLVVNTSPITPPSQYLKSPVDSVDTSSITSSGRRTKREIMSPDSGDFKCQLCPAGFKNDELRKKHQARVHCPEDERPFPCSKCEWRFVFKKDLIRHDVQKHSDRKTNAKYWCPFTNCKYAEEGFIRKDHFERHYYTHFKADSAIDMSRSTSTQSYSQP